MHGLIGLMAATVGFAAAAAGIGNGAAAQIAQTGDLLDEIGSSGHQILKRIGHEVDLQILAYLIRTDQCHKKKKCPNSHFYVAHPRRSIGPPDLIVCTSTRSVAQQEVSNEK